MQTSTTYTVLVTIAHSMSVPPSSDRVAKQIERGLEEGVRDMPGVEAASASAVVGDYMGVCRLGGDANAKNVIIEKARKLHAALRA